MCRKKYQMHSIIHGVCMFFLHVKDSRYNNKLTQYEAKCFTCNIEITRRKWNFCETRAHSPNYMHIEYFQLIYHFVLLLFSRITSVCNKKRQHRNYIVRVIWLEAKRNNDKIATTSAKVVSCSERKYARETRIHFVHFSHNTIVSFHVGISPRFDNAKKKN